MLRKLSPDSLSIHLLSPVRIAGIYLVVGVLWILFSDQIVASMFADPAVLTRVSIYKGWGYVFVTALLLYFLIRRHTMEISDAKGQLRESEGSYWELLNNASDGIFIADASGRYVLVNEEACKLAGYTRDELLSISLRDLIAPENLESTPLHLDQLHDGKTLIFERILARKDGLRIICELSARKLPDGRYQSIVRDITERKIANDALTREELRYRTLFENMVSGFARCQMLYDENEKPCDFIYLEINEAFKQTTGLNDVIGKRVTELIPGIRESNPDVFEIYGRVAMTGMPEKFETYVPGLGSGIWFSVSAYSPQKGFFVALFEIVTGRKHAEELLQQSHKQLLSFIEQAPLSIAMFDREMNYLAASRRWVAEYGRGYKDLIGRNHYEVHSDVPDYWKDAHQRGLAGESLKNDDDVWVQTDGTKYWLRWAITPWTDENGKIGGIIISAENISERKRAEASAFQSEARYHRVLDAMMEGCQIIDFDWRYVYVNDVVARQAKYTREELLNHTMMEVYPGIEQTDLFSTLQKCMADREQRRMENKFIFPDGVVGWFELSIQPAQEGLFILSTDITERKHAEEMINNLARFPEENPNPVLRVDRNGQILYANSSSQVWLDELHTSVGEMLPDEWRGYVSNVYNNNTSQSMDVSIQNRVFANVFVPIKDADYVNIYGRDNTQRKQAEERLRLQNLRLKTLREIDTAILAADSVEHIVGVALEHIRELIDCERANLALIEWEKNEAVNFAVRDSTESAISKGVRVSLDLIRDVLEILSRNQPVIIDDLTTLPDPPPQIEIFIKEGLRSRCILPLFSHGSLIGSISLSSEIPGYFNQEKIDLGREVSNQVAIAITQSHLLGDLQQLNSELEQRVIKRTSQLEAANKELEAFAYSVSHDLRAPLRAISGYTSILVEEYGSSLDEEGKRICGVISDETQRMGRLIDDLLAFSRVSRREVHSQKMDMKALVDSVLAELLQGHDRSRIEIQVSELHEVIGDAALMRQVWINLLSNAIKFTSRKKRAVIEVKSSRTRDEVIYSVRDNGAGFEMEYVNKLFGVFQRLHGESEFEGTGVGLAIVQKVVQRHGGRVWAKGKVDEGAVFYFAIPGREHEYE